jgi:hypothetical protein
MKLAIDTAELLLHKYATDFKFTYLNTVVIDGMKFRSDDEVARDHLSYFKRADYKEIEVRYTNTLYGYLSHEFPLEYRKPYGVMKFIEIDRHLENLNFVNTRSKRKRFLYTVGDIYGVDSKTARRISILHHNEVLDYAKWNAVKRFITKDQKFHYRNSEHGIILFVNLKDADESTYVQRFKKNTDLIAAIVSQRKNMTVEIAPDLITTEDIISVTDPKLLLDEYIQHNSRLIIIGENLTPTYKRALNEIIQYDRYVRLMVVPSIDPRNLEHFLFQTKLVYNANRWSE